MAGRLTHAASRILGGNGVVGRSVASSLRLRSGMGLPVGKHIVPDKPVRITSLNLISFSLADFGNYGTMLNGILLITLFISVFSFL